MRRRRSMYRDERGATYVMALIFFLVCATVAAVVMMAASVNAEHAKESQEEQQAYLGLSSAAQMLVADAENQGPAATSTTVVRAYTCPHRSDKSIHPDAGVTSSSTELAGSSGAVVTDTALMSLLKAGFVQVSAGATSYERDFVLSVPGFDDVDGSFSMDASYDVTIALTSSDTVYRYSMTIRLDAEQPSTKSTVATTTGGDSHADGSWTWYSGYAWLHQLFPSLYPIGDTRYGYYATVYYDYTDTTTTTTVSWGTPVIVKGVES